MTEKYENLGNNQAKESFFSSSFVVYQFNFPGCCVSYVCKTERTLHKGCIEHPQSDKKCSLDR